MLQARRGLTGIMNYTNPGAISHNEILELYKSYIDPDFSWKNFSLEEQAKVIIAPRSNNLLDTARVSACVHLWPHLPAAAICHLEHPCGQPSICQSEKAHAAALSWEIKTQVLGIKGRCSLTCMHLCRLRVSSLRSWASASP